MAAATPPVLPPGYMSVFQAIECVDPGALPRGTDQERKDADTFLNGLDWGAINRHGMPPVPEPVYDEMARRERRRHAFDRVRELCAYGTVPSALLPDDFSQFICIPPANWLDDRLSADLRSTGRTTIGDRPTRVSGWVMIDTAAFRTAIAPGISIPPHSTPSTAKRRGPRTDKGNNIMKQMVADFSGRAVDLDAEKQTVLESRYGAARSTVESARKKALRELTQQTPTNSDK